MKDRLSEGRKKSSIIKPAFYQTTEGTGVVGG
jgi:hypothetical protein